MHFLFQLQLLQDLSIGINEFPSDNEYNLIYYGG